MKKRSDRRGNRPRDKSNHPNIKSAPARRTNAPTFTLEPLEPRILLSATWADATEADDVFNGTDDADIADGLGGNDELHGGLGDDQLIGGAGGDLLYGDEGADILDGGSGDDQLFGGDDGDILISGGGSDTMDGGAGDDTLQFTGALDGDVITVDGSQDNDTIDLSGYNNNQITDDGASIAVDMGGGQSFTINYTNIESVVTAEGTYTPGELSGAWDPESGLVGKWGFDEGQGLATDDAVGSLDGTLTNMDGSEWDQGPSGGSLTFDGVDDYVHVDQDLSPTLGGTASVGAWIRTTQTGVPQSYYSPSIIGSEQSGGTNDVRWGFIDDQGRIGVGVGDDSGARSAEAINDGEWHHVAFTRNSDSGEVKVYVDGQLSNTFVGRTGLFDSPIQDIGRTFDFNDADPETAYFQGNLDELRIYNSELSDAQIAQLAGMHTPPSDPPTAEAGADQTVDEGSLVTLDAGGSTDPEGQALTYAWTQTGGPSVNLSDATAAQPSFNAPEGVSNATLTFQVEVSDGTNTSVDAVSITVNADDDAPTAEAGADQTVDEGSLVTLDAGGSTDPEGQSLTYAWTQTGGPSVNLSDATAAQPSFNAPDVSGDTPLTFEVSVSDGTTTSVDTVSVVVEPNAAIPSQGHANAGGIPANDAASAFSESPAPQHGQAMNAENQVTMDAGAPSAEQSSASGSGDAVTGSMPSTDHEAAVDQHSYGDLEDMDVLDPRADLDGSLLLNDMAASVRSEFEAQWAGTRDTDSLAEAFELDRVLEMVRPDHADHDEQSVSDVVMSTDSGLSLDDVFEDVTPNIGTPVAVPVPGGSEEVHVDEPRENVADSGHAGESSDESAERSPRDATTTVSVGLRGRSAGELYGGVIAEESLGSQAGNAQASGESSMPFFAPAGGFLARLWGAIRGLGSISARNADERDEFEKSRR